MEEKRQFSGCTISSYDCRCMEKLTQEEQLLFDENSVRISYKKGEIICKQGGFVSQIMYVEEGLAKVYIDNGKNALLLRLVPGGSFIGLSAVADELTTFPYSAKVYGDTVIRQIDVKTFRQVLEQNNAFAREIINILSANSVQIYGRFFCLTYKQAYGRLADILLCLSERVFKKTRFDLPLSRKDIAELSGMSAETVVRLLRKFSEDNLVRIQGKSIEVMDVEKLQRISETG
jgi:CRP/FNR family transcriptional regulator, polysaccharide utilization system transcription regulator